MDSNKKVTSLLEALIGDLQKSCILSVSTLQNGIGTIGANGPSTSKKGMEVHHGSPLLSTKGISLQCNGYAMSIGE